MKQIKRKKKKNAYYTLIFVVIALVCAITCAAILLTMQYKQWKAKKLYDKLAEQTTTADEKDSEKNTEPTTEELTQYEKKCQLLHEKYGIIVPEKNIDFDYLTSEVSPDIYAWIYIPNTNVDYPVLQHPTDNSYYGLYNLDGSEGYPGCIYTQNYNSKDFTDRHTVIYGHNMRDGTMFSDLHKFEDEEYFYEENNRYVFIYTPDDVFAYRIFAAYQTNSIHQLLGYDIETDEAYLDYLNGILTRTGENCIVDGDIEVDADTKLLTLSTCVMAERQFHLRYLVRGVMLDVE